MAVLAVPMEGQKAHYRSIRASYIITEDEAWGDNRCILKVSKQLRDVLEYNNQLRLRVVSFSLYENNTNNYTIRCLFGFRDVIKFKRSDYLPPTNVIGIEIVVNVVFHTPWLWKTIWLEECLSITVNIPIITDTINKCLRNLHMQPLVVMP